MAAPAIVSKMLMNNLATMWLGFTIEVIVFYHRIEHGKNQHIESATTMILPAARSGVFTRMTELSPEISSGKEATAALSIKPIQALLYPVRSVII